MIKIDELKIYFLYSIKRPTKIGIQVAYKTWKKKYKVNDAMFVYIRPLLENLIYRL